MTRPNIDDEYYDRQLEALLQMPQEEAKYLLQDAEETGHICQQALDILQEAVESARSAGYAWPWVHKAEDLIAGERGLVCIPFPSSIGNPHQWVALQDALDD